MAIALGTVVVHNAVKFVCAYYLLLLAGDLHDVLDLDNVINLVEVHQFGTEHKAFQVDHQDLRQGIHLCLL